jgi:hypothetical protein
MNAQIARFLDWAQHERRSDEIVGNKTKTELSAPFSFVKKSSSKMWKALAEVIS